jgi:hypothetical protein
MVHESWGGLNCSNHSTQYVWISPWEYIVWYYQGDGVYDGTDWTYELNGTYDGGGATWVDNGDFSQDC